MSKTVFVTGAASGIGLALASRFAREKYNVIISDLNLEAAQAACDKLLSEDLKAVAYQLDVASQESIDRVSKDFPEIDILINNAGLQHVAKIEDFPPEKWQLLTNVLLVGPAMLIAAVVPGMKERNYGRIINTGSIHSMVASPFKSAYVAAKHGLLGLAKVVALETAEFDITINTICPSYVKTPLVEKQISAQAIEHNISEEDVVNNIMLLPMPKKEFISFDELAETALYLVSPAARNMTAQTMVLDGGWVAR